MGTQGGGAGRPVAERLFSEGYRFDFYQAVRLLEILRPESDPVGERSDPRGEPVRFRSHAGFDFPASDVVRVTRDGEDAPAEMTVAFLGVAGGLGPLPRPFTELLLERVARKDTALRDFLDVFNHRLVSLMYRARKKHRLSLATSSPEESGVADYLYSLLGLGTPGLRGRMEVRERALLGYAGLLAQRPRSLVALERVLADYFQVRVKGDPLRGRWLALEEDQLTRIGEWGRNQVLGGGAVLGTRVWEQQGALELRVGPLSLEEFTDFLPTGTAFRPLCELTRFHAGTELDFTVRLLLKAEEVPPARLGGGAGTRLGWTSWLRTRDFAADDEQVVLRTPELAEAGARGGRGAVYLGGVPIRGGVAGEEQPFPLASPSASPGLSPL